MTAELPLAEKARDLGEREGIAAAGAPDGRGDRRRDRGRRLGKELQRRVLVEAAEVQHRQGSRVSGKVAAIPGGEEHSDPFGAQAAGGEEQCLGGFGIDPVQVVDDDQHGLRFGDQRNQVQRRHVGREAIAGQRRPDREGRPKTGRLDRRQAVELGHHRPEDVRERGKGQGRLRLDTAGSDDRHPRGRVRRVLQQSGLSGTCVAAEQQDATDSLAGAANEAVDGGTLRSPSKEHASIVAGRPRWVHR